MEESAAYVESSNFDGKDLIGYIGNSAREDIT